MAQWSTQRSSVVLDSKANDLGGLMHLRLFVGTMLAVWMVGAPGTTGIRPVVAIS